MDPFLIDAPIEGDILDVIIDPSSPFSGDWWSATRSGNDLIIDFTGFCVVTVVGQFSSATPKVSQINFLASGESTETFYFRNTMTGDTTDEFFVGTAAGETITTGGGNNIVHAGAGDDTIIGSSGGVDGENWEDIYGGDGDDLIVGNGGDDEFAPGAGNDTVDARDRKSVV